MLLQANNVLDNLLNISDDLISFWNHILSVSSKIQYSPRIAFSEFVLESLFNAGWNVLCCTSGIEQSLTVV